MPITEILQKNADFYPEDVSLVEINPKNENQMRLTWRDYALIESNPNEAYRKELTWKQFNISANRFANLLLSRGIKKGDKVAILLMNCIEWLPIYFGILKTGALAVPLNYRYAADEIKYCLTLADADAIIFGPEFTGRIEQICSSVKNCEKYSLYSDTQMLFLYSGACPTIFPMHTGHFDPRYD